MRIAIDGNEANVKDKVGVHQYANEILWSFYRINNQTVSKDIFTIFLSSPPNAQLPKENEHWKYVVIPGKGMWVLLKLFPYILTNRNYDVLFSPSHYLPPFVGVPMTCTIHDLGYLNSSEQFTKYDFWQLKYWTAISVFMAKKVISVSQSTKDDIVRHYPFAAKKVNVVYHGYDNKRFNPDINNKIVENVTKQYKIPKNYILFLSTLKPSKNIEGLVSAFRIISEEYKDLSLVIAGKKGWLYESIFKKVKEENLLKKVIFTDFVSEEDKPALIKGAKLFVSPSFWEGFGMHILESMAIGTPVVVSKVASIPEVVGSVGIYVNPKDVLSIADGIKKILKMGSKDYNSLSLKLIKRAGEFSWEKCGKETLDTIKSTI